jgi:hypothetical protein
MTLLPLRQRALPPVPRVAAKLFWRWVDWTTDDNNPGAMRFYETLGFAPRPSKIFYRLEGDRLRWVS